MYKRVRILNVRTLEPLDWEKLIATILDGLIDLTIFFLYISSPIEGKIDKLNCRSRFMTIFKSCEQTLFSLLSEKPL